MENTSPNSLTPWERNSRGLEKGYLKTCCMDLADGVKWPRNVILNKINRTLRMKITSILFGCMFLILLGCDRDLPVVDQQDIYIIENQRTTLPLIFRKDEPHVECMINGKKAVMLIDTGSTGVLLFSGRLDNFGVKIIGVTSDEVYTAGGSLKFEVGDECTLTFADTLSARIEHPYIVPNPSRHADGIVGSKLLQGLHCVINFCKKTISLGQHSEM